MRNGTENQMKMTLVFIRHGETKANRERRYLGKTEESISGKGAEDLLKYKKQNRYPRVDVLFSSPMKRCLQTAEILYPGLSPVVIPEWKEMDFGIFEYRDYEELKDNIRYQEWLDSNGQLPFPKGEGRDDFVLRCEKGFAKMWDILCRAAEEQGSDSITAGLVVHGGTIMALLSRYGKGDYFDYQVSNGKGYICRAEKTDGIVRITGLKEL